MRENMLGYLSADISVPRSEQFSESVNCELKLCPRTNIRAYFWAKWRLLCWLSYKYFTQHAQFRNRRIFPSFSLGIFGHMMRLDQSRTSENIWRLIILHVLFMADICSVAPHNRQNCGWGGISPQECENKGCCFDSSISGVVWCFFGNT